MEGVGAGGGGLYERTVDRRCVSQMTISSYRRKIRTLYLYLHLFFSRVLNAIEAFQTMAP